MNNITVSIATVTYNHEKYIEKCIQSVIEQKVNFKIEMIIGEDYSTDNTKNIVKKYEKLYPKIIRPIYNKENFGKKFGTGGGRENFINVIKQCKGKYIAILDGDDYFLPEKLQKQVDFMENHQSLSMSGHNVQIINEKEKNIALFNNKNTPIYANVNFLIEKGTYISNNSIMYKKEFLDINLFNKLHPYTHGDWLIHIIVARNGAIGYIDEVLAIYRKHSGGITLQNRISKEQIERVLKAQINILDSAIKLDLSNEHIQKAKAKLYYNASFDCLLLKEFKLFNKLLKKARDIRKPIFAKEYIINYLKFIPKVLSYILILRKQL